MPTNGHVKPVPSCVYKRVVFRYQLDDGAPPATIHQPFFVNAPQAGSLAHCLDADIMDKLGIANRSGVYDVAFFEGGSELRRRFFSVNNEYEHWLTDIEHFVAGPEQIVRFTSKDPQICDKREGTIFLLFGESESAIRSSYEEIEDDRERREWLKVVDREKKKQLHREAQEKQREAREKHLQGLFGKISIPDGAGDFFAELRDINHAYRAELAKHVSKALNAYLEQQRPENYEEKKSLALEINTLLREFGLAISHNNKPCLLRATLKGEKGLLRLEIQDSRQSRPVSSVDLGNLLPFSLVEEAPRAVCNQGHFRKN
jgi:hypothetical protein